MKVSVIIAAYNAEKYLPEALQSALGQTLSDYEVIVVNDGSSDSTPDILGDYSHRYKNLIVINKENGGPSSARNTALEIARGEYVYFIDADDIMEADSLECLYNRAEDTKADLVIAKYDIFNRFKRTPVKNLDNLVLEEKIDRYDTQILWTFSLWNKLFRLSVIKKMNLRMPPISYSEDGVFVMNYVYSCQAITGLDQIVYHYRRELDEESSSITATVAPWKVHDYITAHHMILASAEKSILRDHPEYASIEQAKRSDSAICDYMNDILRKELQVLLNAFYAKYWDFDEETAQLIINEIHDKSRLLDLRTLNMLENEHPDVSFAQLYYDSENIHEQALVTCALYDTADDTGKFITALRSVAAQNLVRTSIIVPAAMKQLIAENNLDRRNVLYLQTDDPADPNAFFRAALSHCKSPYIVFGTSAFHYASNAFKYICKNFNSTYADFIIELIYHTTYGEPQPVFLHRIALDSVKYGMHYNDCLGGDRVIANKFFRTQFLRDMTTDQTDFLNDIEQFYTRGYSIFRNDGIVLFQGSEFEFLDYVGTDESRPMIREIFADHHEPLAKLQTTPAQYLKKLQDIRKRKHKTAWSKYHDLIMHTMIEYFRKKPIKNQVYFISIRKDGELEGNAKALYPYVNGKKKVFAKQLPHNLFQEFLILKELARSKVIVTDDYVRNLRYFPLQNEQRVIQLWHACGAFKKFGQRGTNMAIDTDLATHAQYNLACVSGEAIRPIYADAFGIELAKVKPLGTPRTDLFFDETYKQATMQKIYDRFPEWKDKEILLYAPTFRDIGNDRSVFKPMLDFDRLSASLRKDQVFIICPHPLMKNDIVEKAYDNIKVIREFTTNELMFVSSLMITDYSSVIFEYVLLKKPIVFYCYDLAAYNRGFYLRYPDDLPGEIYQHQDELEAYLIDSSRHVPDDRYETFARNYMSGCDGHSCERIAGVINEYMGDQANA